MPDMSPAANRRFRPATVDDFKRYARHLADLIDIPLQRAQQVLAKAYGYTDHHELQTVLKQPGEPGPFEDHMSLALPSELREPLQGENGHGAPRDLLEMLDGGFQARNRRLEECVAYELRARQRTLDDRINSVLAAAGFFCSPYAHRRAFARLKDALLRDPPGRADRGNQTPASRPSAARRATGRILEEVKGPEGRQDKAVELRRKKLTADFEGLSLEGADLVTYNPWDDPIT